MPQHPGEAEIKLANMSDEEVETIAVALDKLGIADKIEAIYKVSQQIFSYAIDFMKKIGVLNEFVDTLDPLDEEIFMQIFTLRPKKYGGNPFET